MGIFEGLFKAKKPFLNQTDIDELKEIEKKAYLEEARKLVEIKGKEKAKAEIGGNNGR